MRMPKRLVVTVFPPRDMTTMTEDTAEQVQRHVLGLLDNHLIQRLPGNALYVRRGGCRAPMPIEKARSRNAKDHT